MRLNEQQFNEAIQYLEESQEELTTKVTKTIVNEGDALKIDFFKDKEKIGTASVCPFKGEKTSFIYNVEVLKEFRGKGYGTKIMNYMIKNYGVKYLHVDKNNEIALNLYKKLGFKIIKTFPNTFRMELK